MVALFPWLRRVHVIPHRRRAMLLLGISSGLAPFSAEVRPADWMGIAVVGIVVLCLLVVRYVRLDAARSLCSNPVGTGAAEWVGAATCAGLAGLVLPWLPRWLCLIVLALGIGEAVWAYVNGVRIERGTLGGGA